MLNMIILVSEEIASSTDLGSLETTNTYLLYIVILLVVFIAHSMFRSMFNKLGGVK